MVVTFHLANGTANGLFTCPSKFNRLSRASGQVLFRTLPMY